MQESGVKSSVIDRLFAQTIQKAAAIFEEDCKKCPSHENFVFRRKAAQEACSFYRLPAKMSTPLYLLLQYSWNDTLDWAAEILKNEK